MAVTEPIWRATFRVDRLATEFPVRPSHPNKRLLCGLVGPPRAPAVGAEVHVARWPCVGLPEEFPASSRARVDVRPTVYDYSPGRTDETQWHMNFAGSTLFSSWELAPFAQDEIQVAEHPVLGSLREALRADRRPMRLADGEDPTPITIRGAPRQASIALGPLPGTDAPDGIYGRRFARASEAAIRAATRVLEPPTISNIVAAEAPSGRAGAYSRDDVRLVLSTAYCAFASAVAASDPTRTVTIHTGFWGCGAYGGNRTLMIAVQTLAAALAGVSTIVFHASTDEGAATARAAAALAESVASPRTGLVGRLLGRRSAPVLVESVIGRIESMRFPWGESDGN